jgi:hypothetical protein
MFSPGDRWLTITHKSPFAGAFMFSRGLTEADDGARTRDLWLGKPMLASNMAIKSHRFPDVARSDDNV